LLREKKKVVKEGWFGLLAWGNYLKGDQIWSSIFVLNYEFLKARWK
jgi:hypothetical protein